MQTHRIPQHVTGFQGRILGKLTAKQFIYLAIGATVVFTILVTLPISMSTIIVGSLISFVTLIFALAKIEDRSMDEWLVNFTLALQSTPQYIWKKESIIPTILTPGYKAYTQQAGRKRVSKSTKKMDDFINFWREGAETDLTEFEESFLEKINNLQ
ncbi:PrgI family protein [Patescibacteria group bacterium]|nr:PrgI family protein [Patescibacteria group bacterium]MBU1868409.1 PrgI family protein [Patescibacteria group bacterium]